MDAKQAPDIVFRFFALVFPVLGVSLLLLAAHVVAGALRPRSRGDRQERPSRVQHRRPAEASGAGRVPHEHHSMSERTPCLIGSGTRGASGGRFALRRLHERQERPGGRGIEPVRVSEKV